MKPTGDGKTHSEKFSNMSYCMPLVYICLGKTGVLHGSIFKSCKQHPCEDKGHAKNGAHVAFAEKSRVILQICFAFIYLYVGHRVCESHTELHANEQIPPWLVCYQRYTCLSYIDSRHVTEEPLVLGGVL